MATQAHAWYVAGSGSQPAGPFTAQQIMDSLRAGSLGPQTPCWREGLTQWLPLAQVEPFATVARKSSAAPLLACAR